MSGFWHGIEDSRFLRECRGLLLGVLLVAVWSAAIILFKIAFFGTRFL
jgi:hypothetical protein